MTAEAMKKAWGNYQFESSTVCTDEFAAFAKGFKKCIKDSLPEGAELVDFSRGHFYVSGFVKYRCSYMYFSTSDVRFFRDEWYNHLLVRTAKYERDFTGGFNQYITLPEFKEAVEKLCREAVTV
jgi:hypothetical protein